jgi:hypothetical protein
VRGLWFLRVGDFHSGDEAVRKDEAMADRDVREQGAGQIANDLMHFNQNAVGTLWME